MGTNALRLGVSGQSGFRFDSVSVHARSLDAAKSTTYACNTSNQLTSSVTNGTTTNYAYDAWGRLLTRTAGTATASYAYRGDKLKQVTSTFPGEASTVAMNYDGLGRRRNRMANGVTPITWWRYGLGWDTVAEYTDNDTDWAVEGFSKFNVMTDFMNPLAEATVASGQTPANAAYSYLALDHLSSTRGVFSQTKTQTGTMEFLPYGARHTATGTLPHHQFTAKPYDTGTGLYTFPYRHYSPAMARWTGADPAGIVDGPNVYGYVRGEPVARIDQYGLCREKGESYNDCANRKNNRLDYKLLGMCMALCKCPLPICKLACGACEALMAIVWAKAVTDCLIICPDPCPSILGPPGPLFPPPPPPIPLPPLDPPWDLH